MHGKGTFYDPRLNDPLQFPVAAGAGFANVRSTPDLITPKLAALHFYQLAIPAPTPPAGSFDAEAAQHGEAVFNESGCAGCHVPPLFTEPGWNMHTAEEIGIDDIPGEPVAGSAVPHDASPWALHAPKGWVLPRRPVCHAARCRRPL
jgi:mono/diheme cytochrome c family protein